MSNPRPWVSLGGGTAVNRGGGLHRTLLSLLVSLTQQKEDTLLASVGAPVFISSVPPCSPLMAASSHSHRGGRTASNRRLRWESVQRETPACGSVDMHTKMYSCYLSPLKQSLSRLDGNAECDSSSNHKTTT